MQSAYAILSFVACPALQCSCTLSHKWQDSYTKVIENKCVLWVSLQILSETIFILRTIQLDIVVNMHKSSCKVAVIIVRFERKFCFIDRFSKNCQTWNFMKIHLLGAELFDADGQVDRHAKGNSRFLKFRECSWKSSGTLPKPLRRISHSPQTNGRTEPQISPLSFATIFPPQLIIHWPSRHSAL